MDRREAVKKMVVFVPLGISFATISGMGLSFISPKTDDEELRRIFAVNLEDLPVNESKKFKDLRGKDLLIIRTGENEVVALSTVCTHLGCTVYWEKDKNRFLCPCHNGIFSPTGEVLEGPPPEPLHTYKVDLVEDNVYIYCKEREV